MKLRRRLTLTHAGRPFLERWGLVWDRIGGFYLHKIEDADPGMDVHDHPWSFITIILRGGYVECAALDSRDPFHWTWTTWRRFTVHRMPLTVAHRIVRAEPGTWTLVLRGPTRRVWGFYLPRIGDGIFAEPARWVPWTEYDYVNRRANTVISNVRDEQMEHG